MNLKRFRFACQAICFVLRAITITAAIAGIIVSVIIFMNPNESTVFFNLNFADQSWITLQNRWMDDSYRKLASLICVPFIMVATSYIYWQASTLFKDLADGETPFSLEFAKAVKKLSILLMIYDTVSPLLYSLILTIIVPDGHYFVFGLSSNFFIGLVAYIVSEILTYGIELQRLSDDTV